MSDISKFGDVLVNFLFSAAKLKATASYDGVKVSNHVLMQALNTSNIKSPPRTDKHQKGDFVESIIAKAWNVLFSTEEMIDILAEGLYGKTIDSRKSSVEAEIESFVILLNRIHSHPNVSLDILSP
ncbi:MAG: ribonuclease III family protein [Candidatus Methanofastidiosia archaeon]